MKNKKMLMKWWALAHNGYKCPEELLFAIPNGGQRNAIVGVKLKEEENNETADREDEGEAER